jgi:hypothetical protein
MLPELGRDECFPCAWALLAQVVSSGARVMLMHGMIMG